MTFSFIIALPAGCNGPREDKPVWEQIKLSDLVPSDRAKGPSGQLLKTINFDVHIFEMPAEKLRELDGVWEQLYMEPLRFSNYATFGANTFSVGFGQIQIWNTIAERLDAAGVKKMPTVSLLLADGQAGDVTVVRFFRRQPLYYISPGGLIERPTIGPGKLALRVRARKIPGARGVCYVEVHPVFSPPISSSVPQLADRAKAGELPFIAAGFGLKMSQGDFFLLGPEEYISDQVTLGSLFFSKPEGSLFFRKSEAGSSIRRPERKPAVRIFLVVCTSINI